MWLQPFHGGDCKRRFFRRLTVRTHFDATRENPFMQQIKK
jgi:hypothetical protein